VKRIVFWTMAIILIVIVAMFVFTNKTGGAAALEEAAKKLEEKHIDGNVYAKFQGFALDHGFEYEYILKSDQEELMKARYQPFSGTVTILDLR